MNLPYEHATFIKLARICFHSCFRVSYGSFFQSSAHSIFSVNWSTLLEDSAQREVTFITFSVVFVSVTPRVQGGVRSGYWQALSSAWNIMNQLLKRDYQYKTEIPLSPAEQRQTRQKTKLTPIYFHLKLWRRFNKTGWINTHNGEAF